MAEHLGLEVDEFLSRYARRVGGRYTLKEVENYNCVMLGEKGCTVYEVRPIQCRTFPFWDENLYSRRGWKSAAESCPGMGKGRHFDFEEIERLRARFK